MLCSGIVSVAVQSYMILEMMKYITASGFFLKKKKIFDLDLRYHYSVDAFRPKVLADVHGMYHRHTQLHYCSPNVYTYSHVRNLLLVAFWPSAA